MMILREALSRRFDGYWELLATAAGAEESIAKSIEGIRAEQLHRGPHGLAIAPSVVRERVEAIAAWNVRVLAELSRRWIEPRDIDNNPWWTASWVAALRHLKHLGVIQGGYVDAPELSHEVKVLWGVPEEKEISWRAVRNDAQHTFIPYLEIRKMARSRLIEQFLTEADIEEAPTVMLRLLRGRSDRLSPAARTSLASMGKDYRQRSAFEAAILIEICKELSLGVCGGVCRDVARRASEIEDPRAIVPLAYVLLGEWHVP